MSDSDSFFANGDMEFLRGRIHFDIHPHLGIFRPKGREIQELVELSGWWDYFKRLINEGEHPFPYCAGGVIKETTKDEGYLVYGAMAIYMPHRKKMYRRLLLCIPKPGWECDELVKAITEQLVQTFVEDVKADRF